MSLPFGTRAMSMGPRPTSAPRRSTTWRRTSSRSERDGGLTLARKTLLLAGTALLAICGGAWCAPSDRVREDWLAQNEVRWRGVSGGVTTEQDARGAVDGVIDGGWGFHTDQEDSPWWQVDLGEVRALDRIVVYNRCDGAASRAGTLRVLLSADGQSWTEAYVHDGTVFMGFSGGPPLEAPLQGSEARYVRLTCPGPAYLHLDEVELYGPAGDANLALHQPANQSSVSQWSQAERPPGSLGISPADVDRVARQGQGLALELGDLAAGRRLREISADSQGLDPESDADVLRGQLLAAHEIIRPLMLSRPELDFDDLLFVKRQPGSFTHMSDQNYGWWSRPGGGIFVLEDFRTEEPTLRCLTEDWPEGSFTSPDISYDGERILFAYCRHYPELAAAPDKVAKEKLPEDGFYHLYEMSLDGSGLRQLTSGRYDDFDGRYLPSGDIAFLSTRRGQFIQTRTSLALSTLEACLPDSYVRCGGDAWRPVAVYTLHVLDPGTGGLRAISPFENFEWTPAVAADGRILYARWDYVDRDNMPYMGLWSTLPDGTNPRAVYGNFTKSPHCVFEARPVPGSGKLLFTASGHHSITGGSLVLLDPSVGVDGPEPITRVTPEVCFPEIEGWPETYYANPWPLSETCWLTAWSDLPLGKQGATNPPNAMGLYVGDVHGNLELIYRDPDISSMYPIPIRSRHRPPVLASDVEHAARDEGSFLLLDIYDGMEGIDRGAIRSLRVVGVPPKTQPNMNTPHLGVTGDDPGKFVVGTVPVQADGSAHFSAPAGVSLFFQALDEEGRALRTMRSATYLQPGQTLTCIGCHEDRGTAPGNVEASAAAQPAALLEPEPEGSWPLRYDRLVQPVLDRRCVDCHSAEEAAPDLSPGASWQTLLNYGQPSLADHVWAYYREGSSPPGTGPAIDSPVLAMLGEGHHDVTLTDDDRRRLVTWMDTYGQFAGSYSADQENRLIALRERLIGEVIAPLSGE
ncbi:MAG: hypothetical protein GF320_15965 [Armatimonadia bacterium]|nr:hypothetical protein [Armatimonadia bacterium]